MRPKAPHEAAPNGGGAACGAQGAARLAADAGRLEPPLKRVIETPGSGSNIYLSVASPINPMGSWAEYSDCRRVRNVARLWVRWSVQSREYIPVRRQARADPGDRFEAPMLTIGFP